MKKYIFILLVLSFISNKVYADTTSMGVSGTFQLLSFSNSQQAILGQRYQTYINFLYSGQGIEHVSIIGNNLPNGMNLGAVSYGENGLDNILFSGTPYTAGDYPLELVLTDNDGAILTQPFDFKVSNYVTFTTTSLPDAIVGQGYSAKINFTYLGDNQPNIVFYDLDPSFTTSGTIITSPGNGFILITGKTNVAEKMKLQLAVQGDNSDATTSITFNVDNPAPEPVIQPETTQVTPTTSTHTLPIIAPLQKLTSFNTKPFKDTKDTEEKIKNNIAINSSSSKVLTKIVIVKVTFKQKILLFFKHLKFW